MSYQRTYAQTVHDQDIAEAREALAKEDHGFDLSTEDGQYEFTREVLIRTGDLRRDSPRVTIIWPSKE